MSFNSYLTLKSLISNFLNQNKHFDSIAQNAQIQD